MTEMLWVIPVVWAAMCWLLSLRRTPFAVGWLAVSGILAGAGALIVWAAESVHHTIPGIVAAIVAGCLLPTLVVGGVEIFALESPGASPSDIARWRQEHRRRRRRRRSRDRWGVCSDPTTDGVKLFVRQGAAERYIGEADPLADMDTFMELRARADQAAETLNALKIGGQG